MSDDVDLSAPSVCDRCGYKWIDWQPLCPGCGLRRGMNWPGVCFGLGVLVLGTIAAFAFQSIDWFLFLAPVSTIACLVAHRAWKHEKNLRSASAHPEGTRT